VDAATGRDIWDTGGLRLPATSPLTVSSDKKTLTFFGGWRTTTIVDRATGAMVRGSFSGSYFVDGDGKRYERWPLGLVAGPRYWGAPEVAALGVVGTAKRIIAADDKLSVTTLQGSIYCFGGEPATPRTYSVSSTPLPDLNDAWKTGHSGVAPEQAAHAYKLAVNIVNYAFNQYMSIHFGE